MSIKRRSFLAMLGAVVAAPAMPVSAGAARAHVFGLAAAHVHKYPFISVIGLSRRLGVSMPDAETLLVDLSRKGLVGPVNSCGAGVISAASKVFKPSPDSLIKVAQAQRKARQLRLARQAQAKAHAGQMQVDLTAWLGHLRTLCVENGFAMRVGVSA